MYGFVDTVKTNVGGDSVTRKDTIRISKDALSSRVDYESTDSMVFTLTNKKITWYHQAKVNYEDMELQAEIIELDMAARQLFAKGGTDSAGKYADRPHFKDTDNELESDSMWYNFATKKGRMQGLDLVEGEGYIHCNKVFRDNSGNIFTDYGTYTTCNHKHPHFYLKARKLKIVPEKKLVFGPANIVLEDVPTPAFLPFGLIPTKKGQKSGILIPDYNLSATRGYAFRNLGYYFGISDYFDLTLRGDFYFRGSWAAYSDARYAKRYRYNGSLNLAYAYNLFGDREDPDFRVSPDFRVAWTHNQDAKARPGTTFNANVNVVSSKFNLNNAIDPNQIVANTITSGINFGKVFNKGKYNFNSSLRHNQNTQTQEISFSAPALAFGVSRFNPFQNKQRIGKPRWYENIGVSYQASFENNIRTYDSLLFAGKAWDQFKYGARHSIPVSTSFKMFKNYFTLTPSFNANEYWYFKQTERTWNPTEKKVEERQVNGFARAMDYSFNTDLTTMLFGTYQFKKGKIQAIRHVITPRISLNYRPDFSSEQFGYFRSVQVDSTGREERYSIFKNGVYGGPGGGKNGIINAKVDNYIEMKIKKVSDTATTYEKVKLLENFMVNTNYNFLADSFRYSNVFFNAYTTLFKKLRVQGSALLDPYSYVGNRKIDKLAINDKQGWGRWRRADLQLSVPLDPEMFGKKKKTGVGVDENNPEAANIKAYKNTYYNFEVPWNMNVNFNLDYTRSNYVTTIRKIIGINGMFTLTPKWQINYTSGYDFTLKEISYTEFNIARDLHCWQISFDWVPAGFRKSFTFTLRAKSSLLQDLKLNKRRNWFDY